MHDSYRPEFDSYYAQKLYKGVYQPNEPEESEKVLKNVSDFIKENKTYKKLYVQLHEKVEI